MNPNATYKCYKCYKCSLCARVCLGKKTKKKIGVDSLHPERLAQVPRASRVPPSYATGEVLCRVKPP